MKEGRKEEFLAKLYRNHPLYKTKIIDKNKFVIWAKEDTDPENEFVTQYKMLGQDLNGKIVYNVDVRFLIKNKLKQSVLYKCQDTIDHN